MAARGIIPITPVPSYRNGSSMSKTSTSNWSEGRDIGLPHAKYAALSYCWGSAAESKAQLRTDNAKTESRFLNGIQEQELPPAVRDARHHHPSLRRSIPLGGRRMHTTGRANGGETGKSTRESWIRSTVTLV